MSSAAPSASSVSHLPPGECHQKSVAGNLCLGSALGRGGGAKKQLRKQLFLTNEQQEIALWHDEVINL